MQRSFRFYFIAASVLSTCIVALLLLQWPEYQALPKAVYDKFAHPEQSSEGSAEDKEKEKEKENSEFNELKWGWEMEMPWYDLPTFDFKGGIHHAAPMNWEGEGRETFATLYASRNAAIDDPYFMAVQQIIYRLLWRAESMTKKHTVTVFVLPFISQEQRDYFTAAGALVKEVPEEVYHPDQPGSVPGRWRDMFSKLDMWSHTEYSKIAYLDSDAFPLVNIDSIFEISKPQTCRKELLPAEDVGSDLCEYTFAGSFDGFRINCGVLVFSPDELMYERLLRLTRNHTMFDQGEMEQSLLNYAYRLEGPFPWQVIPRAYNGGSDTVDLGGEEYVFHDKLWNTQWEPETKWYKNIFNETWHEMVSFYNGPEFKAQRLAGKANYRRAG